MLKSFEHWLTYEKRYSVHTIKSYLNDLRQFEEFLESGYPDISFTEVNNKIIKSWIVHLMDIGMEPRTVNRKIVSLNGFYRFLLNDSKVQTNPCNNIQGPKTPTRIVKYLEEEELVHVLDGFEFEDDFNGVRDQLILETLYGTGIRLSELIEMKTYNIDLNSLNLKVLGKRNKERILPINASLKPLLEKYLDLRKVTFGHIEEQRLLLTDKGKAIYPMLVYRVVKKYLDQQASKVNVSPHVLRHSFATHLINKGADINAIKELLGHANLAATQIYTHNTIERLKNVFKQAHPRG